MKPSLLGVSAPRTRRQHMAHAPGVSLHVDRIVLEGFPRAAAREVREALTAELVAALAREPRFARPVTGGGITRAAMTHTLNAGAGAGQIGDAIAKALMGSIGSAVRGAGVDAMTKNASLPGGKER
jgi:hypothetical protein